MTQNSRRILLLFTLVITALWFTGSWWHYACNIKGTCGTKVISNTVADTSINTAYPQTTEEPIIHSADTDNDGLTDEEELQLGTDPLLTDTDGDNIPDNEEAGVNLATPLDSDNDGIIDALDIDDDNDGLSTLKEDTIGTSSLLSDTDNDGISDSKEVGKQTDKPLDTDNDGIINALDTDDDDDGLETHTETFLGTNPLLHDTDGDGLSDLEEIGRSTDSPKDTDNDGVIDALDTEEERDQDSDGLSDAIEAKISTNPAKVDSDGDGINDLVEVGSNPEKPIDSDLDGIIDALDTVDDSDTDNDGITDEQEKMLGSNPNKKDSDNDGINDNIEIGKNIEQPLDTDEDGILNINDKDDDNDRLTTRFELNIGTNPLSKDSDGDNLDDAYEVRSADSTNNTLRNTDGDAFIDAIDIDDDNDKLLTATELKIGTDPYNIDTDDDGIPDAIEVGNNVDTPIDSDNNGFIDAIENNSNEIVPMDNNSPKNNKDEIKLSSENSDSSTASVNKPQEPRQDKTEENKTEIKEANTPEIILLGKTEDELVQSARLYLSTQQKGFSLSKNTAEYLSEVVNWMKKDRNNLITITAHTDDIGSNKSNLAIGIRKVMVMRELLLDKGAPMSQIDVISKGESQPLTSNTSVEGRKINRRIEIQPSKLSN